GHAETLLRASRAPQARPNPTDRGRSRCNPDPPLLPDRVPRGAAGGLASLRPSRPREQPDPASERSGASRRPAEPAARNHAGIRRTTGIRLPERMTVREYVLPA